MMQEYDSKQDQWSVGTNTSSESACTLQPSSRVIRNILNYARATQTVNAGNVRIRLCLN